MFPGNKTVFFSHLYIKLMISPRQARDKHSESTDKDRFVAVFGKTAVANGGLDFSATDIGSALSVGGIVLIIYQVRQSLPLPPQNENEKRDENEEAASCCAKMITLVKTSSGQT
jgi:hypothetical protein